MKTKTYTLLMLILFLAGHATTAQYLVRGKVTQSKNEPTSYVTIGLLSAKDSSILKGVISDDLGFFKIENISEGDYVISIQYVGFKKKLSTPFSLNTGHPVQEFGEIFIEEEAQNLNEVTVAGSRNLVEQKNGKIILNVENSVLTKGNKVEDLLKYAPLVSTANGIKVGNKGNVLILIDGRQTSSGSISNFLQNFSAEEIMKIEVIPNPSAKYDASYGAVINIVTKKSLQVGVNGRLGGIYSQGQKSKISPEGSLNYRSQKWNFFSSVSGSMAETPEDQLLRRQYPMGVLENVMNNLYKSKGLSSFNGIDFTPNDKHSIGLRFNTGNNSLRYLTDQNTNFYSTSSKIDSLIHVGKIKKGSSNTYDANLYYTVKLDTTGKEFSVNVTQSSLDNFSGENVTYQRGNSEEVLVGAPTGIRITSPSKQKSFIAQMGLTLPMKVGQWEIGARYMDIGNKNRLTQENVNDGIYTVDPNFSNAGYYQENGYAAYTSYEKTLHGWSLQAGLRFEHTDQKLVEVGLNRKYSGLFPSLGLSKTLKNSGNFGVSYSRKVSRPALSNLVPSRSLADPYTVVVNNPLLKPSFANSLDLYYSKGAFSYFANYTHRNNSIAEMIHLDPETLIYTVSNGNLRSVHDYFAGLNWNQDLTKWWKTMSVALVSGSVTNSNIGNIPDVKQSGFGMSLYSTQVFTLGKTIKGELFIAFQSRNRNSTLENKSIYWASTSVTKTLKKNLTLTVSFQDMFRTQRYSYLTEYGPIYLTSTYYGDNQRVRFAFSYKFGKQTVKQAKTKSMGNEAEKRRMGAN